MRDTLPTAPTGLVVTALVVGVLVWVIVAVNNVGVMLGLAVVGLLLFRWVRNRRRRQLKRFVRRMRSLPNVRAILVRDTRITVIVDRAPAHVYMRVNTAMETLNGKLFHGDPFESAVRDDMTEEESVAALREPGVVYVRKDVLSDGLSRGRRPRLEHLARALARPEEFRQTSSSPRGRRTRTPCCLKTARDTRRSTAQSRRSGHRP